MTQPQYRQPPASASESTLLRVAIWVAIGALIAAAIVCVVWVLIGSQNGIIGRAFLTILLLAAFAGVAILDAHLAARRPPWFALTSMIVWVVILLLGAFLIWLPERGFFSYGFARFTSFLAIILILQLAVLHVRLFVKAYERFVTPFTTAVAVVTTVLVAILAIMLVFPLAFGEFFVFQDVYWRWVVALAILAAVGTALIPLVNALFAPKRPRPARAEPYGALQQAPTGWPTYADGFTPLPVLADGSPDWTAYYTGYPTNTAQAVAPVASHAVPPQAPPSPWGTPTADPAAWDANPPQGWGDPTAQQAPPAYPQPGYEGYPPPPPLPPQH